MLTFFFLINVLWITNSFTIIAANAVSTSSLTDTEFNKQVKLNMKVIVAFLTSVLQFLHQDNTLDFALSSSSKININSTSSSCNYHMLSRSFNCLFNIIICIKHDFKKKFMNADADKKTQAECAKNQDCGRHNAELS